MNRLSEAIDMIKEVRDKLVLQNNKTEAEKLSLAIYKICTHQRDEDASDEFGPWP